MITRRSPRHNQNQQQDDSEGQQQQQQQQSFLPTVKSPTSKRHHYDDPEDRFFDKYSKHRNGFFSFPLFNNSNNKMCIYLLVILGVLFLCVELSWNYNHHRNSLFLFATSTSYSSWWTDDTYTLKRTRLPQQLQEQDFPKVTRFDDKCFLVTPKPDDVEQDVQQLEGRRRLLQQDPHHFLPKRRDSRRLEEDEEEESESNEEEEKEENTSGEENNGSNEEEEEDDEDEEESSGSNEQDEPKKEDTVPTVKSESHQLGPCFAKYPQRVPPSTGWLDDLDWFHHRTPQQHASQHHAWREACYLYCIEQLDHLDNALLSQAVVMGLPRVVDALVHKHGLDPLQTVRWNPTQPSKTKIHVGGIDWPEIAGLNAIQHAIRMGQAQMVASMGNIHTKIDEWGRSVYDYITQKGSPIRPFDAKRYLHIDTTRSQYYTQGTHQVDGYREMTLRETGRTEFERLLQQSPGQGWNEETSWKVNPQCDIDIVYGSMSRQEFYRDYFVTGRPFVLRGIIPTEEIKAFQRQRWETLDRFDPDTTMVSVGPTAYPSLTNQELCEEYMSITAIERGDQCPDMPPETPILHAWHPIDQDFVDLFPSYKNGDVYDKKSGWRKMGEWFHPDTAEEFDSDIVWQVFYGGDESGATMHWHNAAFNVLYVGLKEWKIMPPWYRAYTGMTAKKAKTMIENDISLSCTQQPGDFVYIPNYWGHMTLNHGFTIGAATIMTDLFQSYADDKPRIHFVHINKTGGTSIVEMLADRCEPHYVEEFWNDDKQRTFHATAHALIDHNGRDAWDNAYTFTLVRHPLSRAVSNFFFLAGKCSPEGDLFGSKKCDRRLIPTDIDLEKMSDQQKIDAFHKYFQASYENYPPGSKKQYLFGSMGHGNERFDTFNATQTSWLVDEEGKIAVKHIFRLETLANDMGKLVEDLPCLRNDGSMEGGKRGLLEMLHENESPDYPDYKLFGRNKRSNEILREVFAIDYKNFGYEF